MAIKKTQHRLKNLDHEQVIRTVYNEKEGALNVNRVNSLVPASYGKVELTYTTVAGEEVIDTATFYGDGEAQITQVRTYADVAGSLNSKYFYLYSANDDTTYYVWFNNGTGIDPAPGGASPIEVSYLSNDAASVVAVKTAIAINNNSDFAAEAHADSILITCVTHGASTNASDFNTGFKLVTLREGADRQIVVVLQMGYDVNANLTSAERIYYG